VRIGTICYATDSGLGRLAKAFRDHNVVTDVLMVRHAHFFTHDDWYPDAPWTPIRPFDSGLAAGFCATMDAMLFFETPFDWTLISHCRAAGVKTVVMPMHECMPRSLADHLHPDLWFCPSLLDMEWAMRLDNRPSDPRRSRVVMLSVPVDAPWRQRRTVETWVHNAGHGGLRGRNGSQEIWEALPLVKRRTRLIFRSQELIGGAPSGTIMLQIGNVTVDYRLGTFPIETLWDEGDAFIFPEKFNGLSLPLQEARAAGMLVAATDRFPINTWLPREPLIKPLETRRAAVSEAFAEFDEAVVDPRSIAAVIDGWTGENVIDYSLAGRFWAEEMSWETLRPKYLDVLERLIEG